MGFEIERKYLLHHDIWNSIEKPKGQHYRQGYIIKSPTKTIRVRLTDTTAYLTIKGEMIGLTRPEFEYEIPQKDAQVLLDDFSVSEVSKIRYKITYEGKLWEVDVFLGDNEGLIVAEIELESENETFAIPEWVSREVTREKKYYNSRLSVLPYKSWQNE